MSLRLALALALLIASGPVFAGRVHPELEKRLGQRAEGGLTAVIVELEERVSPSTAATGAPERDRRGRGRAVVNALKDKAEKTQGPIRALLAQEDPADARNVKHLWVVNAIALEASEKLVRKLAQRPDVREVRLDKSIPPPRIRRTAAPKDTSGAPPAWNLEQIRAPEVWALGYSGTGAVVGSFDTGVDGTHPDLVPNYRGNDAISWFDPYGENAQPFDGHGHGTHTTGTMVASGETSGFRIGVAPAARWIAAKGWNDEGNATASAFHRIFQWFLAPGGNPDNAPDVVNASWGMDPPSCDAEFVTDVQALRAAGIVPVFASGNAGPGSGTTLAPGNYATSFSVGATEFGDFIAEFSSQGPSQCDGAVKPDVSAPGAGILSTLPGHFHFELDGTSMAAPHVSGAAAVLRSIVPSLTVEELEAAIVEGSVDLGPAGPDNAYGAGRLDLLRSASLVLGLPIVGIETTAGAAEAGLAPGRFTVRRSGSATAPLAVAYTVGGSAIPGSDYVALSGTVTIPSGASSAFIDVTPIDDAEVELTETVVVTLTPNPAYLPSPSSATMNLASDELLPDLTIAAFAAPDSAGEGLAITVTDTTRNAVGTSPPTTTSYYLSPNWTYEATDTLIASRSIPSLGPGASHTGSLVVTIPAGTATGTWYLVPRADANNVVPETIESNNASYRVISIGPDLTIASLTAPTSGGAGEAISVSVTVRNSGGGLAAASSTQVWYSEDWTQGAGDTLLGTIAVPALAAGATHTASITVTLPAAAAAGTRYLIAVADSAGAVAETVEANNASYRSIVVGTDLTFSAFTAPASAGQGLAITVSDTTRNAGAGAAAATTTSYYLSANAVYDASDTLLGSRSVAALAPGASDSGSASVTIPAGTTAGTWYLFARADAADAVPESNEGNNTTYRVLTIGTDLTISAFTAPTSAGAGLAITVGDTTRNSGAGPAAASTTSYYLSANWTYEASDTLLGSRSVAALAPGTSDSGSASVTIPAGTATGTWYLIARADAGTAVSESNEANNTWYHAFTIGPDLTVSAFTAPTSTGQGLAITVSDTTRNAGAGPAAASTTSYYLSSNWTYEASDTLLGSRSVAALAPGASDSGSATVTIPAGTAAGSWYLIAHADAGAAVSESNEANNTSYHAITVGTDLTITAFTAPASAGEGLTTTVSDTTRNAGAGAAAATTTSYYLSANWTYEASDALLGSRSVAALAPGASDSGSATVTIPAGTAAGSWYLIARADAGGTVSESNEGNNTSYRAITIGTDLTISAFTAPTSAGAGLAITVSDTTRNGGAGAAAASTTSYYLSANWTYEASDTLLGSRSVASLAPGANDTGSATGTIPAGTATGTWYLIARADAGGTVSESNEANNTWYHAITIGTDLTISAFTAPASAGEGIAITVSDTTRNAGAGAAAATTTSYYLSANWTYEASDTLLGSRSVAALAPGASDSGSASVTIPAGTSAGTWYLIARADAGGAVSESNEANNTSYRAITIGTDLTISAFTAPTSTGQGLAITVSDTTRNAGAGAAAATTTSYYLSANWTYEASDTLLGSRSVAALAPGANDTGSATVTIPAGAATGTWYLIARADAGTAVSESNEANNTWYHAITVGTDLTISAFTAPTSAGAGLAITVGDTTRNAGGGGAAATTTSYYLSANWTYEASDTLLGSRSVAALAPGAIDPGTATVTIPPGTTAGTWYLIARADAGAAVSESNEANNTWYQALTIGPDLTISAFTAPASAGQGLAITVGDTTRNAGAGAAAATTTSYYLSANAVYETTDTLLGSRSVAALAPGASDSGSAAVTIPAGTTAGTWYLFVRVDSGDAMAESNEGNNIVYRAITIAP